MQTGIVGADINTGRTFAQFSLGPVFTNGEFFAKDPTN
jgi:hypothetical protein